MGKNRTIKNIIKKRIVINNKGENIIKKTPVQNKSKIKLTNPPKRKNPSIKIIDPRGEINKKKHINIPKNLNNNEKHAIRDFNRTGYIKPNIFKEFPDYVKKENVDFDVAICISSYDRYTKVKKMLEQIYSQKSEYTYKVFFINDGSKAKSYNKFKKMFPEIIYLENVVNGGKIGYWKTITKLWLNVKDYKTHALCQIDDDFILCNNFLNILMDKFFEMKKIDNGYIGFHYHIYSFNGIKSTKIDNWWYDINNQQLDGGVLYDIMLVERMNYSIGQTNVTSQLDASNVWVNTTNALKSAGGKVYRFKESLAYHNGNEDSKLNPTVRKKKKMITKNFLG